jgi:hypothetical protein
MSALSGCRPLPHSVPTRLGVLLASHIEGTPGSVETVTDGVERRVGAGVRQGLRVPAWMAVTVR